MHGLVMCGNFRRSTTSAHLTEQLRVGAPREQRDRDDDEDDEHDLGAALDGVGQHLLRRREEERLERRHTDRVAARADQQPDRRLPRADLICNAMQCNALYNCNMQCNAVQCSAMQCSAVQCNVKRSKVM